MMVIRKTGYVSRINSGGQTFYGNYTSFRDSDNGNAAESKAFPADEPSRVYKIGYVLTAREEKAMGLRKNANLEILKRQGISYYQVLSNEGACDVCLSHNGAVYPVADAVEGENLPPFHPNCKCRIMGFSTVNIHDDPGASEDIFWVDVIMYGGLSREEQARALIRFYSLTDRSVESIVKILTATENIKRVHERIDAFFSRLTGNIVTETDLPEKISEEGIELLKEIEGLSGGAYRGIDAQNQTIGYGHVILEGEDFSSGITEDEATALLKNDLKLYHKKLDEFIDANNLSLNQAQYDALILFSYQQGAYIWEVGVDRDYDFIFLLKSGEWTDEQIIYEIPRFDAKYIGLWRRHMNEALLFTTGEYENYSIDQLNEMGYYWPGEDE